MRTLTATLAAAAVGAAILTGCSHSDDRPYAQYLCTDRYTHIRVDDTLCNANSSLYTPWYYPPNTVYPAFGQRVNGGYSTPPSNYRIPSTPALPKTSPTSSAKTTTSKPSPTTKATQKPTKPSKPSKAKPSK